MRLFGCPAMKGPAMSAELHRELGKRQNINNKYCGLLDWGSPDLCSLIRVHIHRILPFVQSPDPRHVNEVPLTRSDPGDLEKEGLCSSRASRAAEMIDRGGSKLGFTQAILELGAEAPVPESAWRFYGDPMEPLLREFQRMKKPVIVRGCHKNDNHGLIDVLPTKKGVETLSQLEDAVRKIEGVGSSERFKLHCMDWGQEYSPEVHILLQEEIDAPLGLALEHPHLPRIMANCQMRPNWGTYVPYTIARGGVHNNGTDAHYHSSLARLNGWVEHLKSFGILEAGWTYQIEFSLNKEYLFQARPFKEFSPAADFEIPDGAETCLIAQNMIFGITPEGGISVPLRTWVGSLLEFDAPDNPYALVLGKTAGHDIPAVMGTDLKALFFYGCSCEEATFLKHGNYQFMKRAEVSFCGDIEFRTPYATSDMGAAMVYVSLHWPGENGRIFSNGRSGIIVPE